VTIAVLGGAFNPIHNGHLFLAEELVREAGFSQVIFVPSNISAHKQMAPGATAEDRLEMCRLAVSSCPYFIVDDCELRRGGVSYMIDTIIELEAHYRVKDKLTLVLGDDLVEGFANWKEATELARRTRLLVVRRLQLEFPKFNFEHDCFANRLFPLSSSEIRQRLKEGRAVRFLLPEKVYEYIEDRGLYRS